MNEVLSVTWQTATIVCALVAGYLAGRSDRGRPKAPLIWGDGFESGWQAHEAVRLPRVYEPSLN